MHTAIYLGAPKRMLFLFCDSQQSFQTHFETYHGQRTTIIRLHRFSCLFVIVRDYGYWIYHQKKTATASANDFFPCGRFSDLVGYRCITDRFQHQCRTIYWYVRVPGFAMGLAIASYEWMAAATLLVVAMCFSCRSTSKTRFFTMPQFLAQRYSPLVATIMAVFWLLVYVFVNLTSILYLGALAVSTISGLSFTTCSVFLSIFAIIITLGGTSHRIYPCDPGVGAYSGRIGHNLPGT